MDRYKYQLIIFLRAMEFLSIQDCLKVLQLNKYLNQRVLETGGYRTISLKILNLFEDRPATEDSCFDCLEQFTGIKLSNFKDLYYCVKHSYNIFKNPCGEDGFNHWFKVDRGDGWAIENWHCWKDKKTVFVGSFWWCQLNNEFSIPPSDKDRILIIGSPVARRNDCQSVANVSITLTKNSTEKTDYHENLLLAGDSAFRLLCVRLKLEKSASYVVNATFNSKDMRFWAGYYGARFGHLFARIFIAE